MVDAPKPINLSKDIIITIVVILVIVSLVLVFFMTGLGKNIFTFLGTLLVRATGNTGILGSISESVIKGIGSLLPF